MYGIKNGKIYTVEGDDWDKRPQQAMAVNEDGTIAAVGTDEEIEAFLSEGDLRCDLEGKTVLPGFIDSHVHAPGTAFTQLYQINLFGIFEKEPTLKAVEEFIATHPDEREYFGFGFNMAIVQDEPEAIPADWLDEICHDKPVCIQSYDCHSHWLNTCAMKKYGITEDVETEGSGLIQRTPDGKLKGVFTDVRDIGIPEARYDDIRQAEALKLFASTMNGWGYTSIMSVAPLISMSYDTYKAVDDAGELTLRANLAKLIEEETMEEDFRTLRNLREKIDSEKLRVTTAKFLMDGVLEGSTAWLKEPYCVEAGLGEGYNSDPEWTGEGFEKALQMAADGGFQTHNHSIGDATTTMVLDAMENALTDEQRRRMRNVITHLEVVDYDDIPRFAAMQVIAALQPFWHLKEPDFYEAVELPSLGKERAEKIYPAKSFVKAGVRITSSGDYPVSFMNDPFMGIRAGVTRNLYSESYYGEEIDDMDDERYLLNPAERLTVRDMIEAYTINGAYQMFREDEIGSLKPGKKADFIVLDGNPLETDPLKIDGIKVLRTVLGGKTVYERG